MAEMGCLERVECRFWSWVEVEVAGRWEERERRRVERGMVLRLDSVYGEAWRGYWDVCWQRGMEGFAAILGGWEGIIIARVAALVFVGRSKHQGLCLRVLCLPACIDFCCQLIEQFY